MLSTIDRYIIRKFLGTYFLVLGLIMIIAVVFDISEKIDDFLGNGASKKEIIIDYYLNFVAFYGNTFNSMIVFLSTLIFTSRMSARNEVIAIFSGTWSFSRFLRPYLISASIIASFSLICAHYIIPKTNAKRINFETKYVDQHKKAGDADRNIYKQIAPGKIVYYKSFNTNKNIAYGFTLESFDGQRLNSKLMADIAIYDTIHSYWTLYEFHIRHIAEDDRERIETGRKLDTVWNFDFERISPQPSCPDIMVSPELKEFIEEQKLQGSENVNAYLIEIFRRSSFPSATYVLVLIGVSLASRKKRGGIGTNIAIGLMMCVTYVFFMQVSTTFSTLGNFPPLLAVWLPNIVFSILAAYLIFIARK